MRLAYVQQMRITTRVQANKDSDVKNVPTVGFEPMTLRSLGRHHIHYATATCMCAYNNTCVSEQRVRCKECSHRGYRNYDQVARRTSYTQRHGDLYVCV